MVGRLFAVPMEAFHCRGIIGDKYEQQTALDYGIWQEFQKDDEELENCSESHQQHDWDFLLVRLPKQMRPTPVNDPV